MSSKTFKSISLKVIFVISLFVSPTYSFCQDEECHLVKSTSGKIYTVDSFDMLCLARITSKEKTLIFTFGTWCKPCRYHLPEAIELARKYNLEFYVLLIDEENSHKELAAINYLNEIKESYNYPFETYILKDENGNPKKKYRQFLKQITPPKFENLAGMSKYIIIDKTGEVLMVTNWKDRQDAHWKDHSKIIQKKILPLIE